MTRNTRRTPPPWGGVARASTGAWPRRVALLAIACLGAMASLGGCSVSYRSTAESFHAEELVARGWLASGDLIPIAIYRDGEPAVHHAVVLQTHPEPLVLEVNEAGIVNVPFTLELMEEDPRVEVHGPNGPLPLWSFDFAGNFTFSSGSDICSDRSRVVSRDLATMAETSVGPDAVYAEPGVPEAAVEKAAALLARERESLEHLFQEEPPPIALMLLASDPGSVRMGADPAGRSVWVIRPEERDDDSAVIGTIVHEWTHAILRNHTHASHPKRARYLEDGLCEFIAYRVEQDIRGRDGKTMLRGRLKAFKERKEARGNENFDLIALGVANAMLLDDDLGSGESIDHALELVCDESFGTSLGYEVGLAWWLSQTDADPGFFEKVLARLRENHDLEAVLRENQPGISMDALPPDEVLAILTRHAG